MFYKLIRLATFPHLIRSPYLILFKPRYAAFVNGHRFYSKDCGPNEPKCPEQPKKGQKVDDLCSKTPKPRLDVCKPVTIRPCAPRPPPNRIGPNTCPPDPSKMDCLPKPACPWAPDHENKNKKYLRDLILGLLFAAATLIALWYNITLTKPKDDKKQLAFKRPKPTCREPQKSTDLPSHVPYLLIGGGTASFSAFRAIKSSDPTAKVLVISNECYFPYMRPPLSKEMWFNNDARNVEKLIFKQWNGTERSLFYEPNDFYISPKELGSNPNGGVAIAQGYRVDKIDVVEKIAYLDDETEIKYDKCLIATGAKPKNLEVFAAASPEIQKKVTLFRDIFDYQELDEICQSAKAIAVVGGGFLGSELACALGKTSNKYDFQVYQIFKESGNMGKILPEYLSQWTMKQVQKESVMIVNKTEVEDVSMSDKGQLILHLNNGEKLSVDHVIAAVGVEPNTQLAKTSDLEVDPELGGYLVNAEMEARSHLYIAGDCSCFYDVKLGRRRVEHHDHAVVSGRLAGENMTGACKPYLHQSMFWSDLGPAVGYEAIGCVSSELPTVAVFAKATDKDNPKAIVTDTNDNIRSKTEASATPVAPQKSASPAAGQCDEYGKGVIFYLRDEIVVGIVLWNVFNRMTIARQVLSDERKYDDLNEVAKLFNIHED